MPETWVDLASTMRRKPWFGYVLAWVGTSLALWLRIALGHWMDGFPFLLPMVAVTLVAFFGGRWPAALTAVVLGLATKYLFIPPIASFAIDWPATAIALTFYALLCVTIISLMEGMFRAHDANRASDARLRQVNADLESRIEQRTAALMTELAAREKMQAQVQELQKMEAIGQLTGGVAHDFNNLLMVIGASANFLKRPNLADERRLRYIDAIVDTVQRASKLVGQLLAFARRQPLKPQVFNAAERAAAAIDMMRPLLGSSITVVLEQGAVATAVYADPSQFDVALVNLLVNARDAMDGSGQINIYIAAAAPPARLGDAAVHTTEYVAISVSDAGSGIAPEALSRIFEPFYTTKPQGKGTGLGLSQVYGFAKQSSGDIGVRSTLGQGACFTLYLPKGQADPELEVRPPNHSRTHHRGRILVVEDNEEIAKLTVEILSDAGYEPLWANDASEALRRLRGPGVPIDLVFSDIVMPGLNGIELAREIQCTWPSIPIVLTTGYSDALVESEKLPYTLLRKPYTADALLTTLETVAR